jgi:hypothetical protein
METKAEYANKSSSPEDVPRRILAKAMTLAAIAAVFVTPSLSEIDPPIIGMKMNPK